MNANKGRSGVIIVAIGYRAYADIDVALKRIGYASVSPEDTLLFQRHSLMTFRFNRTIFYFPRLGAVVAIAIPHLAEALKWCQRNQNLRLVVFEGPLATMPGVTDVAQILCFRGIDVVLAAEATPSFYQTAAQADFILKATKPCSFEQDGQTCGRSSQMDVVFNKSGEIPFLEFADQFFQHVLRPLLRRMGKIEWDAEIEQILTGIDRHYPRIPEMIRVFAPRSVIEVLIGQTMVEHRCRDHSQAGLSLGDRGGRIILHIGPVRSRKSLTLALEMDEVTKGKMDHSSEVTAFSSLPRGTRSPIMRYEPRFITNATEVEIPGSVTDVFLDEIGLLQGDVLGFILDLARRGINVHTALYNPRGDGLPFAVTANLLSVADEVHSHLGECAAEGCGSPCGQTQVTRNETPLAAAEFVADRFSDAAAVGLSFSPVCREHHLVPGRKLQSTVIPNQTWFDEHMEVFINDLKDPRRLNYVLGGVILFLLLFPGYAGLIGWPLREIIIPAILIALIINLCTFWWWQRRIVKEGPPRSRILGSLFLGTITLILGVLMIKLLQLIIEEH